MTVILSRIVLRQLYLTDNNTYHKKKYEVGNVEDQYNFAIVTKKREAICSSVGGPGAYYVGTQ